MISKLAAADAEAPPPEINRVRRMGTGPTYSSINASTSWGGLSSVASGELGISRIGTSSSMGYDQPWGFGESFAEDLAGALALASPPPKLPLSPSVREGLQRALKASDEDSPYALADEFADSPYALPPPPVAPPPASPAAGWGLMAATDLGWGGGVAVAEVDGLVWSQNTPDTPTVFRGHKTETGTGVELL